MADDRTQFLIDIATKLTGGDAASASLAQINSTLTSAGVTSQDFERAIKSTSRALEESGATVKATSAALSEAEARYKQQEIAADRAAKAVERLASSGKSGEAFAAKQAEAARKAADAGIALQKEAAALDTVKSKAAAASLAHDALKKGLGQLKDAAATAADAEKAAEGTGNLRALASGLGKIGGPAGDAGRQLFGLVNAVRKIGTSLGAIGPYVAASVAIFAIATAALAATAALTKWAVSMADAQRSSQLLSQGVARSVAGGAALEAEFDKLADVVPQSRDELRAMATELANTGLRGKDLTNALDTAAIKAAKLKFGPEFGKQLLSLDVQGQRLHDNLAKTFGGLNIEKLLGGLSTLVALFDSSTVSGQALKFLFETLFQPLVDGAAGVIPTIERLFLYAEILALKAYIALKPYRSELKLLAEAFGVLAAIVVGVLGVAIVGVFTAAATIIGPPIALVTLLIAGIIKLSQVVRETFGDVLGAMKDIGSQMIQGLVNGITGGAAAVVNSIKGVVTGAVDAAKNLLKISSPSKVFEDIGRFTAEGFSGGVDGGAADAQGSVESLVAAPQRAGAGGASGGGGVTLQIENVNVNGANAQEQAKDFIDQVMHLLESDALSIGGGEVPANA